MEPIEQLSGNAECGGSNVELERVQKQPIERPARRAGFDMDQFVRRPASRRIALASGKMSQMPHREKCTIWDIRAKAWRGPELRPAAPEAGREDGAREGGARVEARK